jgi:hypothetical protein
MRMALWRKPYLSGIFALFSDHSQRVRCGSFGLRQRSGMSKTPANRRMKQKPRRSARKERRRRDWLKDAISFMVGLGALLGGAGHLLQGLGALLR